MTDEVDEMSDASRGSTDWIDAQGSKAERLHDLGMLVGYIYSAVTNLGDAICLAEALQLVDAKTLAAMKSALEALDALPLGDCSKSRVLEVFKECTGQP
jgi:hypothetical protein